MTANRPREYTLTSANEPWQKHKQNINGVIWFGQLINSQLKPFIKANNIFPSVQSGFKHCQLLLLLSSNNIAQLYFVFSLLSTNYFQLWFKQISFSKDALSDRTQGVSVDNSKSTTTKGAPQGSILAPILFFLNKQHRRAHRYTSDDTIIYEGGTCLNQAVADVQSALILCLCTKTKQIYTMWSHGMAYS